MNFYGTYLQDWNLQARQHDDRYRERMQRLQQGTSDHDVDYHLTPDGLVRFRDRIYVQENNELKKLILREFHANSYSGHPRYQKTLTDWPNFEEGSKKFCG